MFIILNIKKLSIVLSLIIFFLVCAFLITFSGVLPLNASIPVANTLLEDEIKQVIHDIFSTRNRAMLDNNVKELESLYNKKTRLGTWAFEHQGKKLQYLHNWAEKQGVVFTDIQTQIKIRSIKERGEKITATLACINEYTYVYYNLPDVSNKLRIGTYHSMDLIRHKTPEAEEAYSDTDTSIGWWIVKEWYTDPFADSLHTDNLKADDNKAFITTQSARVFNELNERRQAAVEYTDRYCGAGIEEELYFKYNSKYKNYNSLGGDCANFASQMLFEGGKFKKTGSWNYDKDGSRAWLNAQGFKDYMIYSGRGSLIAHGSYDKVLKLSYKLLPGDFIAYEKKGKIVHISVVSGADSRGYSLINCHNTDRYHVPWDLGWSDKGIKFWLVRVNY